MFPVLVAIIADAQNILTSTVLHAFYKVTKADEGVLSRRLTLEEYCGLYDFKQEQIRLQRMMCKSAIHCQADVNNSQ